MILIISQTVSQRLLMSVVCFCFICVFCLQMLKWRRHILWNEPVWCLKVIYCVSSVLLCPLLDALLHCSYKSHSSPGLLLHRPVHIPFSPFSQHLSIFRTKHIIGKIWRWTTWTTAVTQSVCPQSKTDHLLDQATEWSELCRVSKSELLQGPLSFSTQLEELCLGAWTW